MSLTVLSVAYPLAPVGPDAVGGAEQVLARIDAGLVQAGHNSVVIASAHSKIAGRLIPIPSFSGTITDEVLASALSAHREAIERVLRQEPVDLVHFHGLHF